MPHSTSSALYSGAFTLAILLGFANVTQAQVPGYVPPVIPAITPIYADDTRGVYVPSHQQHRLKSENELQAWQAPGRNLAQQMQQNPMLQQQHLSYLANGTNDVSGELERIAADNGLLNGGSQTQNSPATSPMGMQMGQNQFGTPQPAYLTAQQGFKPAALPIEDARAAERAQVMQLAQAQTYNDNGYGYVPAAVPQQLPPVAAPQLMPAGSGPNMSGSNMGYGQQPYAPPLQQPQLIPPMPAQAPYAPQPQVQPKQTTDGGVEIATGSTTAARSRTLDMHNSLVRLREERISVRRALQRMMDQIGGGSWTVVWDLAEQNAVLPDMEISVYAEEPFMNVMNALLSRIQSRSGQPLRVIRYDNTQRLVITDRAGGYRLAGETAAVGTNGGQPAITERVLKDAVVSLHYDEIPLVDALENVVNQAGKGQWRLRMYAGLDQVLKPAHIEEPFNIAMERLLKLFNLKYEIFPGGKLIVVTHSNRFGFQGANQ